MCFWQYFGSSLQLTPHLHLLVPEVLWTGEGEAVVLPPPDDDEVRTVLARVLRQARRDWEAADPAWAEDEYEGLQAEALSLPPSPCGRSKSSTPGQNAKAPPAFGAGPYLAKRRG